jgi:Putative phage holin Dp-1
MTTTVNRDRPERESEDRDHFLSNEAYNAVKLIALVVLPALGTLYVALAAIWGFPYAQEVVSSLIALDAFVGAIVKVSDVSYNKSDAKYDGAINVRQEGGKTLYSLDLKGDPAQIGSLKEINFKVNPPPNDNVAA